MHMLYIVRSTCTASAFALIGPAVGYAGSVLGLNLCAKTVCQEDVQTCAQS